MAKYAVKCTLWLQVEDDTSSDGVGEAQWAVEGLVNLIKNCDDTYVSIARATNIEILAPNLREEPGECSAKLFFDEKELDNGYR